MGVLMRMTEACLLAGMGTFMAVLSQSSVYWQFINPKYSWLTLVTGVVLVCLGFASLFNTQRQRKISEFLAILVFLGLAATAIKSYEMPSMPEDSMPRFGSLTMEYEGEGDPTVAMNGRDFVKINVAELLLGENAGFVSAGQAYALQGAVLRTPELDQAGYIGLGRLNITCCFADSTGVLTLVKVIDPSWYVSGSWVRVLGVVKEETPFPGKVFTLSGALTGIRSERFVLEAVEVEERPVQGTPFIFEVRNKIPFAY